MFNDQIIVVVCVIKSQYNLLLLIVIKLCFEVSTIFVFGNPTFVICPANMMLRVIEKYPISRNMFYFLFLLYKSLRF